MGLSIHLEPVGPQHVPEVQKLVTSHPDIVGMTRMPDPYPDDGAATWIAQAVPLHEAGELKAGVPRWATGWAALSGIRAMRPRPWASFSSWRSASSVSSVCSPLPWSATLPHDMCWRRTR